MNITTTLTEDEVNNQGMPQFNEPYLSAKNIIIIILVILLAFSVIGINLVQFTSGVIEYIGDILRPLIGSFLSAFAYITGVTLNTTTDVLGDTAKTGIDIAEDTLQSVGNILIDASKREVSEKIHSSSGDEPKDEPEPDSSETSIQNPITSKKTNWCLIGNHNQRRSCASVRDADKCMSGDIFPTYESCINPNLITNVLPDKQRVTLVN